jgi:hypothetical protein
MDSVLADAMRAASECRKLPVPMQVGAKPSVYNLTFRAASQQVWDIPPVSVSVRVRPCLAGEVRPLPACSTVSQPGALAYGSSTSYIAFPAGGGAMQTCSPGLSLCTVLLWPPFLPLAFDWTPRSNQSSTRNTTTAQLNITLNIAVVPPGTNQETGSSKANNLPLLLVLPRSWHSGNLIGLMRLYWSG